MPNIVRRFTDGSGTPRPSRMPNILVTGTRGTGKTTTCSFLADSTHLQYINVSEMVSLLGLHHGWDDQLDSHTINENQVCGYLGNIMKERGIVIDYHDCGFFPRDWFDCVLVLRTDESILHDRLSRRGYTEQMLTYFIEGEIAHSLLDAAEARYGEDNVVELQSDTLIDIVANVGMVIEWANTYWRPRGPP